MNEYNDYKDDISWRIWAKDFQDWLDKSSEPNWQDDYLPSAEDD